MKTEQQRQEKAPTLVFLSVPQVPQCPTGTTL